MNQQSILVVDDELMTRRGLADLLESRKYRVRLARFGKEAVNKGSLPNVALVLMDIKMQGELDGIEAAHQIQAVRPDIPVVFVTAFSDDIEYRRRVEEAAIEVAHWVTKPIIGENKELLMSVIDEELKKVQLRNLCESVAVQFGIDRLDEIVGEVKSRFSSPAASKLLKELGRAIHATEDHFPDIQQRQLAFAEFKTIVMERLWEISQHQSRYHRQLALLTRISVRKLSSLQLTKEHLAALRLVLERLSNDKATFEDVVVCKKALRRSGIETLIRLGEKTDELLQIYDEGVIKE